MGKLSERIKRHNQDWEGKVSEHVAEQEVLALCQSCGENRVLSIYSHPSDLNNVRYTKGRRKEGNLPYIEPIGGGDDINIAICLECGQVQGEFPVPEERMIEYFEEDDED